MRFQYRWLLEGKCLDGEFSRLVSGTDWWRSWRIRWRLTRFM